jgi:hypothetical protein
MPSPPASAVQPYVGGVHDVGLEATCRKLMFEVIVDFHFGFAIQSNPSLKLILCDYNGIRHVHNRGDNGSSSYWGKFRDLAQRGFDVHFVSGSFGDLAAHIPHLRTASPAEQLANAVKRIGR